MHGSFKHLLVKDDAQLRDPARLRRVYWDSTFGLHVATAAFGGLGVGLTGTCAYTTYYSMLVQPMPRHVFLPIFASCLVMGVIFLICARLFYGELLLNPIRAYLKDQASCDFAEGVIERADYLPGGKRADARMMLTGKFSGNGLFIEEFNPSAWAAAVAERGEKRNLKPGDDRYDQKGKRAKLPLPAWVIFRRETPRQGALAGLPAPAVEK